MISAKRPRPARQPRRVTRILGIDFSGATDAGRRTWIAQGRVLRGRLQIDACASAASLLGCAAGPEASCAALVAFLRRLGPAAVGCDFPFSLPAHTIPERNWMAFLAGFGRRFRTAVGFHRLSHRVWGEPRRDCDRAAKTPFAPTNLRLYRQTYHGIRYVLAPLVGADAARVLPLQAPRSGVPWLLECCPASALKRLGCYRSYKGTQGAHVRQRRAILSALEASGLAKLSRSLRETVIAQSGGDALDSVVAAWIAFRAVRDPAALLPHAQDWSPRWPRIEGFVYAGFPVTMSAAASSSAPAGRPRPVGRRKGTQSAR